MYQYRDTRDKQYLKFLRRLAFIVTVEDLWRPLKKEDVPVGSLVRVRTSSLDCRPRYDYNLPDEANAQGGHCNCCGGAFRSAFRVEYVPPAVLWPIILNSFQYVGRQPAPKEQ